MSNTNRIQTVMKRIQNTSPTIPAPAYAACRAAAMRAELAHEQLLIELGERETIPAPACEVECKVDLDWEAEEPAIIRADLRPALVVRNEGGEW